MNWCELWFLRQSLLPTGFNDTMQGLSSKNLTVADLSSCDFILGGSFSGESWGSVCVGKSSRGVLSRRWLLVLWLEGSQWAVLRIGFCNVFYQESVPAQQSRVERCTKGSFSVTNEVETQEWARIHTCTYYMNSYSIQNSYISILYTIHHRYISYVKLYI